MITAFLVLAIVYVTSELLAKWHQATMHRQVKAAYLADLLQQRAHSEEITRLKARLNEAEAKLHDLIQASQEIRR